MHHDPIARMNISVWAPNNYYQTLLAAQLLVIRLPNGRGLSSVKQQPCHAINVRPQQCAHCHDKQLVSTTTTTTVCSRACSVQATAAVALQDVVSTAAALTPDTRPTPIYNTCESCKYTPPPCNRRHPTTWATLTWNLANHVSTATFIATCRSTLRLPPSTCGSGWR